MKTRPASKPTTIDPNAIRLSGTTSRRTGRRGMWGAARPGAVLLTATVLSLAWTPIGVASAQDPDPARIITPIESSLVFARDGSLIGEIGREWRTNVALRALPRYVPNAFVAIEDQRFYEHDGVDVIGIAGAIRDAVRGNPRGASTITQQLVGNMHPEIIDRSDRSPMRKLREQQAAREMEKRYTKEQILEAYLNQIDFGHRWFGIESAARHYFGKPAARLTIAEAATLAAVINGPSLYDPIRHPERTTQRRDLVLTLMAQQGHISAAQAAAAKREPLRTVPDGGFSAPAPYFVDLVRQRLEREGVSLAEGGLRVYTTIEPGLQRSATDALRSGVSSVEERAGYRHTTFANRPRGGTDYLQGMAVAIAPQTGDVLALVGGRDYAASQYNRAANATRQPGSAFKPIVYAAALDALVPASEIIPDTALAIPLADGSTYRPRNADGEFLGALTMRDALALSRNTVAVQLGLRVGMDSVASVSRRLGISTPVALYPSSAIGASTVRPLDFVSAYAAFANGGKAVEPRLVRAVEDAAGRSVWTAPPPTARQVLDPHVAYIVLDLMREAAERGTGTAARRAVPAHVPVAGKTGTTNDNTDVWFVGATPDVVGGVWLGFDRPKTITPGAAGGTLAAPIWGAMVGDWYRGGHDPGRWTPPNGLVAAELDRTTGQLATIDTPDEQRYIEYFVPGTEPAPIRPNPWGVFTWGAIHF
jgi:penicillin-binding protein 1A